MLVEIRMPINVPLHSGNLPEAPTDNSRHGAHTDLTARILAKLKSTRPNHWAHKFKLFGEKWGPNEVRLRVTVRLRTTLGTEGL